MRISQSLLGSDISDLLTTDGIRIIRLRQFVSCTVRVFSRNKDPNCSTEWTIIGHYRNILD